MSIATAKRPAKVRIGCRLSAQVNLLNWIGVGLKDWEAIEARGAWGRDAWSMRKGLERPTVALGGFEPSGRQNVETTGICENRSRQVSRQDPSVRQENRTAAGAHPNARDSFGFYPRR